MNEEQLFIVISIALVGLLISIIMMIYLIKLKKRLIQEFDFYDIIEGRADSKLDNMIINLNNELEKTIQNNKIVNYLDLAISLSYCYLRKGRLNENAYAIKQGTLNTGLGVIEKALKKCSKDQLATQYFHLLNLQGTFLLELATLTEPEKNLLRSKSVFKQILNDGRAEDKENIEKDVLIKMADVDVALYNLKHEPQYIIESASLVEKGLSYENPEKVMGKFLPIGMKLWKIYYIIYKMDQLEDTVKYRKKAIDVLLRINQLPWLKAKMPSAFTRTLSMIGDEYKELSTIENRNENLQNAINYYTDAVKHIAFLSDPKEKMKLEEKLQSTQLVFRSQLN